MAWFRRWNGLARDPLRIPASADDGRTVCRITRRSPAERGLFRGSLTSKPSALSVI
jgi:hypothetical protein